MAGLVGSAAQSDQLARVASNVGALNAQNALNLVNRQLSVAQTRLATGRKINTAEDDPASLSLGTKLRARAEGFMQALDNLGDSKNFLATAEGSLQKINDILIKVRTKSQQAISDIMGSTERSDIEKEIEGYLAEISDINNETQWNGKKLLQLSAGGADTVFQTGANAENTISFKFGRTTGHSSSNLHLDGVSNRGHVNSSSSAQAYMSSVDSAIASISVSLREVGTMMARLTFKEEQVTVAHANTEAAFSRIMNADIAREQVKATTFLILQQIATASLSQANANPQAVLALFR